MPASTRYNRVQWLIRHRSASTSRRTLPAREISGQGFWAGDDLLEIVVTTQNFGPPVRSPERRGWGYCGGLPGRATGRIRDRPPRPIRDRV